MTADEQDCVRLPFTGTHVRLDGPGGEGILPVVEETFPAPALTAGVGPDVMLEISRPGLPVVVRSADDSEFTTLVMPVKAAFRPDIKENREPAR
ncbi:hypothetical protein [Microbispora sp. ATCC PTA-5024]|uniref:hypothetical protein n=1 Tax=Microbispora sp. ATCC PTA-5024 TaxID=316330 RepID=UPI0003DBA2AC|nr:hypothetical protein [Microbispora sp. ATCC PTA-5024]ETK32924.1 hypothetical protein MPTA5024_27345 [Microbispora sp. ATCC PTA-5024]